MKKNDLLQKRNSALDIVRIVAVFSVLSVHFFYNNGFYGDTVIQGGSWMLDFPIPLTSLRVQVPWEFFTIQVRTLTSVCVPLFMILTGYLMAQKDVSKGYYKGIRKTLIVFVLATLACMIVKSFAIGGYQPEEFTLKGFILGILNYSGAQYAWYVEMYIGLFLIAPFLNMAYKGAKTQGRKQLLVFSLFAVAVLPSLLNNFNFDTLDWWENLRYTEETTKILPSFWSGLYPIAYYFAGAYFREFGLKMKTRTLLISFLVGLFLFGAFNYSMFLDRIFRYGPFLNWNCFQVYVLSCAFFVLLTRIPANKAPDSVRTVLWRVSDLALGIYLLSFIFDRYFYNSWFSAGEDMPWGDYITQMFYIAVNVAFCFGVFMLVRFLAKKLNSESLKWLLWRITGLAIGIYLLSVIFWHHESGQLWFKAITLFEPDLKITRFFVMVVPIFICSMLASLIANCCADLIIAAYEKVRDFVKKQLAREDRAKWQDISFVVLLAAGITFALWKAFYGFGGYDESFYLTVPQRLGLGDALFRDEWHLSQMSGVLMLPFVKIYTMIVGSAEGIILAARFFYVFVHAAVTVLLYFRIRKYGPLTLFASLLFFMYVPYNIMAYSYNTMSVDLLTVAGVLMATSDYSKKLPFVFAGLAFAGAVLCSPYLLAGYVLYVVCVIAHVIIKKTDKERKLKFALTTDLFSIKTLLWFTVGAAALAVVVVGFIMIKTGIGAIFENLPKMLLDPEHPQTTFTEKLADYQKAVVECHPNFYLALWAYAAVLLVMIFDKKRKTHRAPYLIASIMIAVFSYIMFIPKMESVYYNAIMFPMIFVGVTSYILCEDKPRTMLTTLFALGIIYSFAVCFSSNQRFYVISMAVSVSNIASIVFLAQLIREMRKTEDNLDYALFLKRTALVGAAFMLTLLGFCEIAVRTNHCFWEGKDLSVLDTRIESGPAKGILTIKSRADDYEAGVADLEYFNNAPEGDILFLSRKTWDYLAVSNKGYGTYSAWLSLEGDGRSTLDRLDTYFEGNPDKRPRYVYVPLSSAFDFNWDFSYLGMWLSQNGYAEIQGQSTAAGKKYVLVR